MARESGDYSKNGKAGGANRTPGQDRGAEPVLRRFGETGRLMKKRSRVTAAPAGPVAGAASAGASITRRPDVGLPAAAVNARGGLKPKGGRRNGVARHDDRAPPGGT